MDIDRQIVLTNCKEVEETHEDVDAMRRGQ